MKKTLDLLKHHAFGTDPPTGMSQDYNKPLIIPAFSDSFSAIASGDESANLDLMKHHYTTHFPQTVDERTSLPADPSKDSTFGEKEIDQLRAQKDEELERYMKKSEERSRQRMEDDFDQSAKY